MTEKIKITNARIITPFRVIEGGSILIADGKILQVRQGGARENPDFRVIDAGGRYAAPGFIDIHVHGGGGHDFMDGAAEAFLGAAEAHAAHGTTSMVPTTLAGDFEELKQCLFAFSMAKKLNKTGARLLGMHLEGPYFAMSQKGAQDAKYIKNPDPAEYMQILELSDDIVRWSAAPELPGALEFGTALRQRGILPSIAHSDALDTEVLEAFEHGYTHVTHLYSCMSGVRRIEARRCAGVIESAFLLDGMTVEIIADGVHLPPSLLKLVYKLKGPSRTALVTDAMRAAGMPEGESILGSLKNGQRVIVEEGVAKLPDRSAFAGSVATADRLVRTMVKAAGIPIAEAVQMMTLTPAAILGLDGKKGRVSVGADADIVVFDGEINIAMTMIGGKIVNDAGGVVQRPV